MWRPNNKILKCTFKFAQIDTFFKNSKLKDESLMPEHVKGFS